MRLKNKKTGKIGYLYEHSLVQDIIIVYDVKGIVGKYKSISELCNEWEDAPEEPFSTSFYTIVDGEIKHCIFYRERIAGCPSNAWAYLKDDGKERIKQLKEVGLYFETEEEAEKAVEKLKAWKRLEDNGVKFEGWKRDERYYGDYTIKMTDQLTCDDKDLDLLFSGDEQ